MPTTRRKSLTLCITAVAFTLVGSREASAQLARTQTSKIDSFVEPVRKQTIERKARQAFIQGRSVEKAMEEPYLCTRILSRDLQHRYEYSKAVAPGEAVPLSMIFSADKLREGRVSLKMSHGSQVQLLEGLEHEHALIRSGEVYQSRWTVAPTSHGIHPVTIELATDNDSHRHTVSQTFYLLTNHEGTRVSLTEPEHGGDDGIIRRRSPKADLDPDFDGAFGFSGNPVTDGRDMQLRAVDYTVSGTVRVDNGLAARVTVPRVYIELQQINNLGQWVRISDGYTNANGFYNLTFSDNSLRPLRLKIWPYADYAQVVDENRFNPTLLSAQWIPARANRVFDWNLAGDNRKWFFVMSKLYQSSQSALNNFGTADMPQIVCTLEPGDAAYAWDGNIGLGRDCWNNEDTIRHEYGHCHHVHIAGAFPPDAGGAHNFGQNGTAAMALTEGYATFFHCVTSNRKDYDYDIPRNPHDVNLERGCFSWSQNVLFRGDRDEGSVSAVMVDIWDEAGEANDNLNVGARRVSDIIRLETPDNLSQFYAYWNNNALSQLADLRVNLQGRNINYGWPR